MNPAARLLAAGFEQIIPLRAGTRIPAVKGWSKRGAATVEEANAWDAAGHNVGLLARDFPAVDIDVDDTQLTVFIVELAREMLGNAPARVRGSRALLMYRTQNPFTKIVLKLQQDDVTHAVEILGDGQQYAVHGAREDGTAYQWAPEPLWDLSPDELTWTDRTSIEEFLVRLTEELEDNGWTVTAGSAAERAELPDQASLQAPTLGHIAKVLGHIPNDATWEVRDEWLKVIAAIRGAGSMDLDGALDLAIQWTRSRPDPDPQDADHTTAAFNSFESGVAVGWNWLVDQARATGYQDATEVFNVEPGPPPDVEPEPDVIVPNTFRIDGVVTFSDVWRMRSILPHVADKLRFAGEIWYVWDGSIWKQDELGTHRRIVTELLGQFAMQLQAHGDRQPTQAQQKPWHAAAKSCQSKHGIAAVITLLEPELAILRDDFDQELMWIGTPDGAINLEDGLLRDPSPDQLISRSTAVPLRPGRAPRFDAFLDHLTGGDPELRDFLQRYAGYTLTGRMEEKVFLYGFGSDSDTGKSTFIHILTGVLGDYARTVDIETFISSRRTEATGYALAQLPGVRLVTATEPKRGQAWDEKTIKTITGGDEIQVRAIYGRPFTFRPQFKLLIAGNSEPALKTVDDAMLRRVLIFPMNHKVAPEDRVDNLADLIVEEEGPQVLAWMVQGALAWQDGGLQLPEKVADATRAYGDAEDILNQWIEEECERSGTDAVTKSSVLYSSWAQWARQRGYETGSAKTFTQELKARGFEYTRTSSMRGFRGLRVRPVVLIGTEAE